MPEIKGDYGGKLKTIKCNADAKLETVAAIDAGSAIIGNIDRVATVGDIAHLGSIGNTQFDIGTAGRVIRVDTLGTVGKLKTVGMIEAGTISEVGHVGTVERVNRIESLGTVDNIPFVYDVDFAGYYALIAESLGLITSPGINSGTFMPLAVNPSGELILDTLGTVERVKVVDNLGTVGRLETIGMIEAGTISEVGRVGTVGDIEHLGSIANTKFNQGSLDDHDRWIKGDDVGTKRYVKVDSAGKLKTVTLIESGTATIGDFGRVGTIGDINHLGSIGNVSFDQGSVSDHKRYMYAYESGTWTPVNGNAGGAHVIPGLFYGLGTFIYAQCNAAGELRTAPGYYAGTAVPLLTDSSYRLKTAPATARKGGKKVVTNMGTAVALVASSTPCISVIVKALHGNAGEIYVGDNTVGSATGYPLQKDEFVSFSCDNVNGVYIDRDAGTQGVSFLYVNY